jgi:hypothetical protein
LNSTAALAGPRIAGKISGAGSTTALVKSAGMLVQEISSCTAGNCSAR